MLRRRRSNINSYAKESTVDRVRKTREDGLKNKSNKLKMSPFPEVRGVPLKENRRLHRLSDVKQSLLFEAEEASSALSSPAAVFHSKSTSSLGTAVGHDEQGVMADNQTEFVRPSEIAELEKQVTPRSVRQTNNSDVEMTGVETEASKLQNSEQPTVAIRSMWDNVVSWMKMAVDLVTFDEPLEAEPALDEVSLGKKRPLADANSTLPDAKLPRVSEKPRERAGVVKRRESFGRGKRKRDGRRMSFEGLRTAQKNAESTNQGGLGQLLSLEPIAEREETQSQNIEQATPISPPTLNQSEIDHSTVTLKSPTSSLAKKLGSFLSMKSPTSGSPQKKSPPSGAQKQEAKGITKRRKSLTKIKASSLDLSSVDRIEDAKAVSNSPTKSKRRRSLSSFKGFGSKSTTDPSKSKVDADSAKVSSSHPLVKSKKSMKPKGSNSSSFDYEPSKTEGVDSSSVVADGIDETDSAIPFIAARPLKKPSMKFSATSSLIKSFEVRQTKNEGLNSLLDGSPMSIQPHAFGKKRIKRQSLREFYGNSVNSPNLTEVPSGVITVRRSPRFTSNEVSQSAGGASPAPTISTVTHAPSTPVPPPPPPVPMSQIPQAPPTPGAWLSKDEPSESAETKPIVNHSRGVLQKMQYRLRSRMKKKGDVTTGDGQSENDGPANISKVDSKMRQWAEIQALSRKITVGEFLELVREKKTELQNTLESLQSAPPTTMEGIAAVVELLQEASQWFSSGTKEMREAMPVYKSLEKKIEVLNEFVQVCSEMKKAGTSSDTPQEEIIHYSDLHKTLALIKEEFDNKYRHWDSIIASDAESWVKLGLPVCYNLLSTARLHLCSLVKRFVSLTLQEASKINGILLTNKSPRTNQAKEKLRECLNLLLKAHSYFAQPVKTCECENCRNKSSKSENNTTVNESVDEDKVGSPLSDEVENGPISQTEGSKIEDIQDGVMVDERDRPRVQLAEGQCVQIDEGLKHGEEMNVDEESQESCLLQLMVKVSVVYIHISLEQFNGFVCKLGRQEICETFEGILKTISLVKSILVELHGRPKVLDSGIISLLSDAEDLGSAIYDSCVRLIKHIVSQAKTFFSASSQHKEKRSKEIVLWLMFGCKYVNQTLEALGSEQADEKGVIALLDELQQMENLLPD